MSYNRKIVLSGVSLTTARTNRHAPKAAEEVMNEIEAILIKSNFFQNASFAWVGLTLRYGLKNEDIPHYQGISKKYGDISLAIEIDTNELSRATYEKVKHMFLVATLKALIWLGTKYQLPTKDLEDYFLEKP